MRPSITTPKITQLRVAGLRVLDDVSLDLSGLTVLIGDNGTGKSSILETLELLRQVSTLASFEQDIIDSKHGGLRSLLRFGAKQLRIGCQISYEELRFDYEIDISPQGDRAVVSKHLLRTYEEGEWKRPLDLLDTAKAARVRDSRPGLRLPDVPESVVRQLDYLRRKITELEAVQKPSPNQKSDLLRSREEFEQLDEIMRRSVQARRIQSSPSSQLPEIIRGALASIELQVPFETRPLWQQRELDIRSSPRLPRPVEPIAQLSRYGIDIANAYLELRNQGGDVWERVLERCRLGIRNDLRNFSNNPARRGETELQLVFGKSSDRPLPVEYLSEGQLSYLCMVALCELSKRSSILAFDEPEVHLHPGLLARVVDMLDELAQVTPVLLSTHSDHLLDCLPNAAASVVLCELDEHGATRLRRPDPEELSRWLKDYRGYGSIRAGGYEPYLFSDPSDNDATR